MSRKEKLSQINEYFKILYETAKADCLQPGICIVVEQVDGEASSSMHSTVRYSAELGTKVT